MVKALLVLLLALVVYGLVGGIEAADHADVEYQASMSYAEARAWGLR